METYLKASGVLSSADYSLNLPLDNLQLNHAVDRENVFLSFSNSEPNGVGLSSGLITGTFGNDVLVTSAQQDQLNRRIW